MIGPAGTGLWPPKPAESDRNHIGIKPAIGLLDARIGHVDVSILEDQGALRSDKVLDSQPGLREKLKVAVQFQCAGVECGVQDPGSCIEKGNEPSAGFRVKAHEERSPQQVSAGMDGVAQNSFAQNLEPPEWAASKLADDEPHLRLGDQQVDVRYIPGDGVLNRVPNLKTKIPPAAVLPEFRVFGGRLPARFRRFWGGSRGLSSQWKRHGRRRGQDYQEGQEETPWRAENVCKAQSKPAQRIRRRQKHRRASILSIEEMQE